MLLLRFGIVAIFVIMLLPVGPATDSRAGASNARFCERYPKTCDASGELFDAFKLKLAYGVTLARGALEARSDRDSYGRSEKLNGRHVQPPKPRRVTSRQVSPYSSTALRGDERTTEWRPGAK